MCISAATLMMASAGVTALGTVMQGVQAYQTGKHQSQQAQADADAAQGEARLLAERIRKQGRAQAAEAAAAQAGAGVSLNDPGALEINRRIVGDFEEDAVTEILGGGYRASALRAEGAAARQAGRAQLGNALLSGAAQATSGWVRARDANLYRPAWERPAPIIRRDS